MTEAEWLACSDSKSMLEFFRGNASDIKLRLFACACCRSFREQLAIDAFAEASETAEKYSDSGNTKAALKRAKGGVKKIRHGISNSDTTRLVEWSAL